ncbi:DUF551 domain-containing protein [Enterobacter cloacae complex sp. 743-2DZ2F-22B]|uniref:DUF551 domain-containing protein n=1 Tax=Enterobacter cloacae complex sp. 743-2DZ2F-22B TaxID=2511985 RepID=UPI00155F2A32|nr:DUF551 domain-containing protein [Enterobacter cloacae complex sp. 743-2DZ2F-22B]
MTLTKEEQIQAIYDLKVGYTLGHADIAILKSMARQLLASMEQEPIAWLNDAYLGRGVVDGEAGSEDAGPGYIPVYRVPTYTAPPAPVVHDIGEIRVGRLPTMNQEDYPGLGDWWVQLRIGEDSDEVLARVYGATPQEANSRAEALACRAAMLQGAEPVQEWIPCSERMPEVEGHYLVWANASKLEGYCNHQDIAAYQAGQWSNEFGWLVTHWMPLPTAPQQEVK